MATHKKTLVGGTRRGDEEGKRWKEGGRDRKKGLRNVVCKETFSSIYLLCLRRNLQLSPPPHTYSIVCQQGAALKNIFHDFVAEASDNKGVVREQHGRL